ncbi:hypothetical protein F9K33_14910 [bacterium]|nr:MAG: hypothetical protein F9K33_14910 [bacterium]
MLKDFTIFFLLCYVFLLVSCTSIPLTSTEDIREFNKASKKYKNGIIYFRDSTYATASTIEIDGRMIYWVDRETKKSQEDLLREVQYIKYYDRNMGAGIGGLLGATGVYLYLHSSLKHEDNNIVYSIFQAQFLFAITVSLAVGGAAGGILGYIVGVPVTFEIIYTGR